MPPTTKKRMSWRARSVEKPNHPRMRTPSLSSQFHSGMATRASPSSRPERSAAKRSGETFFPPSAAFRRDKAPRLRSGRRRTLRRLGGPRAVEARALRGHVAQQLRHLELLAVLLRQIVALGDEGLHPDLVDQADRPAGLRREAQPHDRADIAVLRIGQHVGLEAARGVDRLDVEQPLLDLGFLGALLVALAVEPARIGREVRAELRPQPLPAVGRIFVEALAVLAAEALELLDHQLEHVLGARALVFLSRFGG